MGLALAWALEQSSHPGSKPCSKAAGLCVLLGRGAVTRWVGRRHGLLLLITVRGAHCGGPEKSWILCYFHSPFLPHWMILESFLANLWAAVRKPVPNLEGLLNFKSRISVRWPKEELGSLSSFHLAVTRKGTMCLWQWGKAGGLSGLPALPSAPMCWLLKGQNCSKVPFSEDTESAGTWGHVKDSRWPEVHKGRDETAM